MNVRSLSQHNLCELVIEKHERMMFKGSHDILAFCSLGIASKSRTDNNCQLQCIICFENTDSDVLSISGNYDHKFHSTKD